MKLAVSFLSLGSDIEKIEKADEGKAVYYTLEADGHTKTRKAIVKKTEGIWKVAEITDAI